MEARGSSWRTVILAVGAAGGALLAFSVALLIVAFTATGSSFRPDATGTGRSLLDVVVVASALAVIGAAFLPGAYYSIQRLRGRLVPRADPRTLQVWQGILLVLVWLAAATGAGFLFNVPVARWVTPALYILAIGVPVFFFARLAIGGLHPGSRERLWGAMATGIGLGTTTAMIAEMMLALLGLVGVGIYIGFHPEQLSTMQRLAHELQNANSMEQVLGLIGPWLNSPIVLIVALLFFSVLSPMIEELAKSLAAWSVFDKLASPAQGFAIGAMSGAAFGLVESLLVSATPDAGWTTTLLVRGASTMMHIMAASLTGWGIASLRTRRSFGRLIGFYILAMGLHGAWNAAVVAITIGGLHSALGSGDLDPLGTAATIAGAGVLVILCLAIPLAIAGINLRFRRLAPAAIASTAPAEMWESPPPPPLP